MQGLVVADIDQAQRHDVKLARQSISAQVQIRASHVDHCDLIRDKTGQTENACEVGHPIRSAHIADKKAGIAHILQVNRIAGTSHRLISE